MAAWVIPAIIGGSALASSAIGALSSMHSANNALGMTKKGVKFQKQMYKDAKKALVPYAKGGYQAWQKMLGMDPTGGAGQYLDQLKNFGSSFQFDPNNPTYQFKLSEATKGINQALAARGLYNSRPGLNLLDESNRAITADEAARQYQRGYSRLVDLFNMSNRMGGLNYNKYLDLTKIGMGAIGNTNSAGLATGQGVASSYGNMAGLNLYKGNTMADLFSGAGAMPLNFMLLQNLFNKPTTGTTYGAGYIPGGH